MPIGIALFALGASLFIEQIVERREFLRGFIENSHRGLVMARFESGHLPHQSRQCFVVSHEDDLAGLSNAFSRANDMFFPSHNLAIIEFAVTLQFNDGSEVKYLGSVYEGMPGDIFLDRNPYKITSRGTYRKIGELPIRVPDLGIWLTQKFESNNCLD